ncbi:Zn-ribbon domain-containing OB-fold protein [Rhodococcus sp. IEGM1428]|uniref:Zn-ribbon domain-containing OB-fold protein n=1 Tax=Rhodococcus sp. IEGM1428 TaxID=3392191 RepID=UPI003D0D385A
MSAQNEVGGELPAGIFGAPLFDRESIVWWRGLERNEMTVQACDRCAVLRWPARALCNRCWSFECTWTAVSGTGTVVSWVTSRHPFGPWRHVPYTTALVRLTEQDDILIPATYLSNDDTLTIGSPVVASYLDTSSLRPTGAHTPDGGPEPTTVLAWRAAEI